MRIWKDRMVSAIKREGGPDWRVGLYMNQILVRIPKSTRSFTMVFKKVKTQIVACINRNCGSRHDDVLIYVKMGAEDGHFMIHSSLNSSKPVPGGYIFRA